MSHGGFRLTLNLKQDLFGDSERQKHGNNISETLNKFAPVNNDCLLLFASMWSQFPEIGSTHFSAGFSSVSEVLFLDSLTCL